MCQDYVFTKAWHIETPLRLISCEDQRIFALCTRVRVCVDGGGSPPGQTDSRRNSENFFEVGVIFLVLNLFCRMSSGCCYPPECL